MLGSIALGVWVVMGLVLLLYGLVWYTWQRRPNPAKDWKLFLMILGGAIAWPAIVPYAYHKAISYVRDLPEEKVHQDHV